MTKKNFVSDICIGFEWNKYNQTHYDKENPPPKIVQGANYTHVTSFFFMSVLLGYKFNIFYPDLIDPTVTPRFLLEPTGFYSIKLLIALFTLCMF